MNGLILGRFQLFHKGHESLVEKAMEYCDTILIFIGSSDKQGTLLNPFSYGTREMLIKEIYGDKVIVKPLPDLGVGDVPAWGDYVYENALKYLPSVDYIFFGNEVKHNSRYSEKYNLKTTFKVLDRVNIPISASELRKALIEDDRGKFEKFTNPKIHKYYDLLKNEYEKVVNSN